MQSFLCVQNHLSSSNSFPLQISLQAFSLFILLPRRRGGTRNQEVGARWAVPERQADHWSLYLSFLLACGGAKPGIPSNPSWPAELTSYVPVQRGNTGQASLAVPSHSSSGIWHYSGNGLLWHSSRLNAPTLNFCNWEALNCMCRPWLLRLLIIVVVIDF